MLDLLWGAVLFIVWIIDFILGIAVSISRIRFLFVGEWPSDSAVEAAKRARLKILSPAAQRALEEAEQRRRNKLVPSNNPGSAGGQANRSK
jgi:hypothetical protein